MAANGPIGPISNAVLAATQCKGHDHHVDVDLEGAKPKNNKSK
jgi:hypothetical protein